MAKHRDVSFECSNKSYRSLADALKDSSARVCATGHVEIMVASSSVAGARWYGGQPAVEVFLAASGGKKKIEAGGAFIDRFEIRRTGPRS